MPHDISYEAQDLIRKILVTDPSKRITVSFFFFIYIFQVCAVWHGVCCVDLGNKLDGGNQAPSLVRARYFTQDCTTSRATQCSRNRSTYHRHYPGWWSHCWNNQIFVGRGENWSRDGCFDGKRVSNDDALVSMRHNGEISLTNPSYIPASSLGIICRR
jgi:hypothetical protein